MIDPELQQRMAGQVGAEQIAVPDEQEPVQFGAEDAPDIEKLKAIRAQAGDDALTDEEYALLQMHEHQFQPDAAAQEHDANLAEHMAEGDLASIAQKVIQWVEWDEESRADWFEQEKKGIRALGVTKEVDGGAPFKGASTVVHPMLSEAIVQFQARALEQVWPAGGPVKTAVLGATNDERTKQAMRVEQFMNYQYTQQIPGAFEQTDKMLVRLPLSGSCFIKVYFDPIDGICREFVEPADFIVPYRANDLRTAPRYTERILTSQNDVKKRQVAGQYRNIELIQPTEDAGVTHRHVVIDEIKESEGRDDVLRNSDDQRRTLLECYCELDLKGFEDAGPDGKLTGIALQYIVTVDRDSQKVLSIYRNWKPTDPRRRRIVYHTHYRFMPGLGFYGYGLYHWIGGLSRAATGALRALLDSAQFANMQGGFRAKDAAMPNGQIEIAPGEWKEVDCDSDDLRKAFVPLQYKEPSATLFNLLGALQDLGRRFAGTTEALVGEGNQNTPVGTMLARIEQGSRVQTGIQKRLHEAQGEEFIHVAWLDSIYLPQQYPYAVQGADRMVFKADFDDRIDIIPVSDPNTVSAMQRYFMAEAVIGLADKAPGLYDPYEIHKRALEALRIENIDALLPPKNKPPKRYDPVSENAMAAVGRPIRALLDQAHDAHIAVHQQAMNALPKNHPAVPVLMAHIQEHLAMQYLQQMSQATGIAFQMPGDDYPELPPDVEARVAMAAAQAAQQMAPPPQPDPKLVEAQAEQQRKDAVAHSQIQRDDAKAAADIRRQDTTAFADMQRENAQQQADLMQRHGLIP